MVHVETHAYRFDSNPHIIDSREYKLEEIYNSHVHMFASSCKGMLSANLNGSRKNDVL